MRILIEGIKYSISDLSKILDDSKFYEQAGDFGVITYVGYYHSLSNHQIVYFLPKVFLDKGLVFGTLYPEDLLEESVYNFFNQNIEYIWLRPLLVYFYKSLSEFRKRNFQTSIIEPGKVLELNTNLGLAEYSFLDVIISIVNFYKKNKNVILYYHIEHKSKQVRKTSWDRTVSKSQPIIDNSGNPIYTLFRNRRKKEDSDEELLTYFFSIVNYLNSEYSLGLKLDKSFNILEGVKFEQFKSKGLYRLRKIKYKYFSDTLKRVYHLCELYFLVNDSASVKRRKDEFITVRNYNIVFEDMVDKLFSDRFDSQKSANSLSLEGLRNNKDGKVIDHIYLDKSLLDSSDIFFIGDSKYYRDGNKVSNISVYKQFSYSKNVIQYNIDLFNKTGEYFDSNVKYRDELTEGYNITPNFFISGFINDLYDFDNPLITIKDKPKRSFHFKDRLFDRDTLFIQQYNVNFLFILKSYTSYNEINIQNFRNNIKSFFRNNFIDFFNNIKDCEFSIFEKEINASDVNHFVSSNFKKLNGKCFRTLDNKLLIAKHVNDSSLDDLLVDSAIKELE